MASAAQSLLLEYLNPQDDAKILILEGGIGRLAEQVARLVPEGEILSLDRDIRNVRAAHTQLAATPNASATEDVFPSSTAWDIILLPIPKERRYARNLLLTAWHALKSGGQLFLAGPSKGGAKAVIKDAERLFGTAPVIGYRHHQRVAVCKRQSNFPEPLPEEFQQPGIHPGTHHYIEIERSGGILKLETHPGIFSWQTLDKGTALLLEYLDFDPGSRVWDVGCGYGVFGLSAALDGAAFVAMSDINLLSIGYAQINAVANQLSHKTKIFPADTLNTLPRQHHAADSLTSPFNLIVSNPAFHQGREVNKSMAAKLITQAPQYLASGGRLVVVANRFLNYDKLMRKFFTNVSHIIETSKFHLIEAHID